jgi:hypothetical protein
MLCTVVQHAISYFFLQQVKQPISSCTVLLAIPSCPQFSLNSFILLHSYWNHWAWFFSSLTTFPTNPFFSTFAFLAIYYVDSNILPFISSWISLIWLIRNPITFPTMLSYWLWIFNIHLLYWTKPIQLVFSEHFSSCGACTIHFSFLIQFGLKLDLLSQIFNIL